MLPRQFLCMQSMTGGKRRCFCSLSFMVTSLYSALPLVSGKKVTVRSSSVTHDYGSRSGWAVSHAEFLFE